MLFNMNKTSSAVGLALLTLASSVSGHIILAKPVPYGKPTSSPLQPGGGDYPCQNSDYSVVTMNDWPVGSKQSLEFSGSAVHGGGSCQISVTTDKKPTKDSKFKVIYSIEGGCPGVNGVAAFPFTIPKELPNGEMTMAWSWQNKIGNREFYMNCAPVKVSGGSSDSSAFNKLPDMALANIAVGAGATCKTTESSDYTYENPGEYKTRIGSGPFKALCGGAASPGNGNGTPGAGSSAAPAAPQPTPNNGLYTQAPAASTAAGQPAVSAPPVQSSAAAAPVTSTVRTLITVTAPSGGAASIPASQPSASAPAAQPSSAPAGSGGTCSTDGAIVCNGESQFGLCNHGKVVFQPVAAGTTCRNGAIAKRDFTHRAQRTRLG